MKRFAAVMVGLVLAALGCNRGQETSSDQASPTASATSPVASSSRESPVAMPLTEEDFEDEAERQITADNIEAELDALSREIRAK